MDVVHTKQQTALTINDLYIKIAKAQGSLRDSCLRVAIALELASKKTRNYRYLQSYNVCFHTYQIFPSEP